MERFQGLNIPISKDLVLYRRYDYHPIETEITDTLGSNWMLAWCESTERSIKVFIDGEFQQFNLSHFIYMPPYSILKWKFSAGLLKWNAYISYQKPLCLFNDLDTPCLIPRDPLFLPKNSNDVFQFIQKNKVAKNIFLYSEQSQLAKTIKFDIDTYFREELHIEDLAKKNYISRISLFRIFKSQYSFSPTQYRQRLRLFEAIRLVSLGESLTNSIFNSGFSDVSEFSKQFKRVFYTTPKVFLNKSNNLPSHEFI